MSREDLIEIIRETNNIVFFGGAGVSTESNIPDFRSSTGLYTTAENQKFPPEYMLSHSCFRDHVEDFYDYYKSQMIYKDAEPNKAHKALKVLEDQGKLRAIITQNIDGLHQKAGSENVLELHGSVERNYCISCKKFFDLEYIINSAGVPKCDQCGSLVKPDVILYEEGLKMDLIDQAIAYIRQAEVLIVGGTSLRVYPAAGLIDYYKGDKLILINKSDTAYDSRAKLVFNDSIGQVLESII